MSTVMRVRTEAKTASIETVKLQTDEKKEIRNVSGQDGNKGTRLMGRDGMGTHTGTVRLVRDQSDQN